MNAILFFKVIYWQSQLRKFTLVIAFVYVEHNKFHQTSQLNHAGSTLFTIRTDLPKIPCLGQTGQKPYPFQQHIPI